MLFRPILGHLVVNKIHTASSFSRPVPRPHSYSQLSTNNLAGERSILLERSSVTVYSCRQRVENTQLTVWEYMEAGVQSYKREKHSNLQMVDD